MWTALGSSFFLGFPKLHLISHSQLMLYLRPYVAEREVQLPGKPPSLRFYSSMEM